MGPLLHPDANAGTNPLSTDLATLLQQAADGNEQAWAQLVRSLAPRVHALIVANTGDHELAEEVTQSVFVTLAQRVHDYVEQGRLEAWVFRIAMNRLRDEMRRRTRHARPVGDVGFPEAQRTGREDRSAFEATDPDSARALWEAVSGLSERDQEILHLRHVADMGFKAISEMLDVPVGTLLARHFRAVRRLRTILGPAFPEFALGEDQEQ